MKAITEKTMIVLTALALGLLIAWLIGTDNNPYLATLLNSADSGLSTAVTESPPR